VELYGDILTELEDDVTITLSSEFHGVKVDVVFVTEELDEKGKKTLAGFLYVYYSFIKILITIL
jgi:hypothetical protein